LELVELSLLVIADCWCWFFGEGACLWLVEDADVALPELSIGAGGGGMGVNRDLNWVKDGAFIPSGAIVVTLGEVICCQAFGL